MKLAGTKRTSFAGHKKKDGQGGAGRLLSLERRGWRRGAPQDAGIQSWLEREVPGGRAVVIDLDPGIAVGIVD
ncbi:hypothetical protein AB0B03_29270, partial [Micromonospora chalcea]